MDRNELLDKILQEEDYIKCRKSNNSLVKFLLSNSDGVENSTIARLLMMPEKEVERIYQEAIQMIKKEIDNDNETA